LRSALAELNAQAGTAIVRTKFFARHRYVQLDASARSGIFLLMPLA
jgi:hypothetical protein